MMSDTLGSYGSLAMFKSLQRIVGVNNQTIIGAGGEFSDFQYVQKLLKDLATQDFAYNDGNTTKPTQRKRRTKNKTRQNERRMNLSIGLFPATVY